MGLAFLRPGLLQPQLWRSWLLVQYMAIMCLLVTIVQAQSEQITRPRTRSVFSTIWGGIATAAALAVDSWADYGDYFIEYLSTQVVSIFQRLGIPLDRQISPRVASTVLQLGFPFHRLAMILERAEHAWRMSSTIDQKAEKEKLKILVACTVWLHVPGIDDANLPWRFGKRAELSEVNIREALEWPSAEWKTEEGLEGAICWEVFKLDIVGKLLCLKLGVVPNLEELQFLQTKSGLTTAIAAVQAGGYLIGIIERLVQKLEISPIEAIATTISILVLLQAALYKVTTGSCRRPIISHLHDQEKTASFMQRHPEVLEARRLWPIALVIFLVLVSGPTIAYGVHVLIKSHCLLCSLSALFFQLPILTFFSMISIFGCLNIGSNGLAIFSIASFYVMYASCYVLALVATVLEWKKFNVAGKAISERIIPYIG